MLHCAVCQNQNWTVAEGMVALTLQERLGALTIGGKVLPCVPLICNTCGNTILLNLKVLGLGDIAEPEAKSNSES
jgi:cytochrome c-type biogenesis protein CcmH/NrfF